MTYVTSGSEADSQAVRLWVASEEQSWRPTLTAVADGSGERVGVLGGTFDPPHVGHLAIALEVRHVLALDRVLLMVAGDPWQKSSHSAVTPAVDRLAMTELAAAGLSGVEVSDLEVQRSGPSYMADTLAHLAAANPGDELFLIVGSDAAEGLDTWSRPGDVRDRAVIVVVDRGGREGGRPPAGWPHLVVEVPSIDVSSSDLRRRAAAGEPIRGLVPSAVADLIEARDLYGAVDS